MNLINENCFHLNSIEKIKDVINISAGDIFYNLESKR
jgi:hypothetical protein